MTLRAKFQEQARFRPQAKFQPRENFQEQAKFREQLEPLRVEARRLQEEAQPRAAAE